MSDITIKPIYGHQQGWIDGGVWEVKKAKHKRHPYREGVVIFKVYDNITDNRWDHCMSVAEMEHIIQQIKELDKTCQE